MNQLLRKNKLSAAFPQSLKVNGKMITWSQQISFELKKHFAEVEEKLSDKLQQTTQKDKHKKFLGTRQISSIVVQPTGNYKVMGIITRLDSQKFPYT